MPVPMPTDDEVDLNPPTAEESVANAAGVLSATRTADGSSQIYMANWNDQLARELLGLD